MLRGPRYGSSRIAPRRVQGVITCRADVRVRRARGRGCQE